VDPVTHAQQLVAACGAMMLLVAIVGLRLLAVRVAEMRAKRLPMQAVANSLQIAARLERVQASDNFRNLFEVPVLFYTLVAAALATGRTPGWLVMGAWCFVLLRYVHSAIQCSYNRVLHRFAAFMLSLLLLTGLWAAFVAGMLGVQG
ncbi:MAG: MAPEG family protein, partial [Proteobacteria bacterium]|nr:MAPEG family protein [Pseudomonadota bacterium]